MWLIGRYTEERTRERWQALRLLSTPLPRRRPRPADAAGVQPGRAQAASIADVGERYRRTTMGTLRVAFLSGSVLELAATLGVALVAVTVGRAARGRRAGSAGGPDGAPARAGAVPAAPPARRPVPRERGRAGRGRACARPARGAAGRASRRPAGAEPGSRRRPLRARLLPVPVARRAGAGRFHLDLVPGETAALVGPSGAGKTTVAALLLLFARPRRRTDHRRRRRPARVPPRPLAAPDRLGAAAPDPLPRHASPTTSGWATRTPPWRRFGTRPCWPAPTASCGRCRAATRRSSGDGGRPLSAGERRRIALARAFLRDAPLVILDEPTADLDRASADVVAESVERLRPGRTVLLIAHRPELVEHADRIVALTEGRPCGRRRA